jgi:hypothetical protein
MFAITVIMAGFDITFGINLNLLELKNAVMEDSELSFGEKLKEGIKQGIGLHINTWGASAALLVDPINIDITLFDQSFGVHDSHVAIAVALRSKERFMATLDSMIEGTVDASPLIPSLSIPFSAEIKLDLNVYGNFTVSPILKAESSNLVETDVDIDFDVDLSVFLDSTVFGNYTVDRILQEATEMLANFSSIAPELNAGGNSTELNGLFAVIEDFQDLSGGLSTFIELFNEGKQITHFVVTFQVHSH